MSLNIGKGWVVWLERQKLRVEWVVWRIALGMLVLWMFRGTENNNASLENVDDGAPVTFGTSFKSNYKDGKPWRMNIELDVFERGCGTRRCVMQHFWIGGSWDGYYDSYISYYVDGEKTPSVTLPFGIAHGSDMALDDAPWSAGSLFGKTGSPSGIFNSYKIPFTSNVRVTAFLVGKTETMPFWIILRGTEYPVSMTNHLHPWPDRAKAKTVHVKHTQLNTGEMVPLVLVSKGTKGVLYMTTVTIASPVKYLYFLEGCFRMYDPGDMAKPRYLVSSGMEDYFLGTFYFNRGKYTNPLAGLTDKTTGNDTLLFSAYRIHDLHNDPIYFDDGALLTYRNGDRHGCVLAHARNYERSTFGHDGGIAVNFSSFSLVYHF